MNTERGIIAWFVDNPVAANLLMWFIIISGVLSVSMIRKELVPTKQIKSIAISVAYPSASPQEVEQGITLKIEESLKDISGIKKIQAVSFYGRSDVTVDVDDGFDINKLINQVKIAIDGIKSLPNQAEKPVIKQSTFSSLAIQLQLYGDLTERDAKILAEEIKEDLLAQTDVKKVAIWGDRPFEISIDVDEQQLRRYQLTIADIARKISMESVNLPSGGIASNRGLIILRVEGQSYRQQDFENIVLLTREDGTLIRLGDVADINDGFVDYGAKGYFDGEYSVGIAVFSVGDQDISAIAEQVKSFVSEKRSTLPEGVHLTDWADVTYYLSASQSMMMDNMLWGGLLVFLILGLFLNIKIVFWVIAGLPVCFLGTLMIMPMPWADVSINLVSIFGFILVLGIIVDDAIIIGESVDTEIKQSGFSQQAIVTGVKKVFVPAAFGVLTTVAAFMPMILVEGPWKAAPHAVGFIVIASLLFSLLESKLILPAHLASIHTGFFRRQFPWLDKLFEWQDRLQTSNNARLSQWVSAVYQPLLKRSLINRYITLAIFVALLILTLGLISGNFVKYILLPSDPSDFLKVTLKMGEGTEESETERYRKLIENSIYQVEKAYQKAHQTEGRLIRHLFYYNTSGIDANFTLELTRAAEREIDSFEIIKRWRQAVGDIPTANRLDFSAFMDDDGSRNLSYMLTSRNKEALTEASNALYEELKSYRGLSNLSNTEKGARESYILGLKPKAESLGLTLADVSRQVHEAFYGAEAQRIQRDDEEIRVMVRYPKEKRENLVDLQEMDIKVQGNRFMPLSELVSLDEEDLQSSLTRINYQSASFIRARVDKNILSPDKIDQDIKDNFIPALLMQYPSVTYKTSTTGVDKRALESDLVIYFLIALMAVFALLAIPLKSYVQPLIIMCVIPFGIVGAVAGHWIMGYPISMMSLFGIIALSGVVVNDSLIMVDHINKGRDKGVAIMEAAMSSGALRFRAIFLTTLTTFAGVAPMMMENAMRAENFVPMAISLGFGILFATVITLFLVPCCYLILDDIKRLTGGKREGAIEPV